MLTGTVPPLQGAGHWDCPDPPRETRSDCGCWEGHGRPFFREASVCGSLLLSVQFCPPHPLPPFLLRRLFSSVLTLLPPPPPPLTFALCTQLRGCPLPRLSSSSLSLSSPLRQRTVGGDRSRGRPRGRAGSGCQCVSSGPCRPPFQARGLRTCLSPWYRVGRSPGQVCGQLVGSSGSIRVLPAPAIPQAPSVQIITMQRCYILGGHVLNFSRETCSLCFWPGPKI